MFFSGFFTITLDWSSAGNAVKIVVPHDLFTQKVGL
jgi:hypothetical protein